MEYHIEKNGPEIRVRLAASDSYGLIFLSARALAELLGAAPPEASYERSGFIFAGNNRSDLLKRFWAEMIYHYAHNQARLIGAQATLFNDRQLMVSVQFAARENGPDLPCQILKAHCQRRPSGGWSAHLLLQGG